MSNSLIRAIKQQIADVLLADPYFSDIPIMPVVKNDVLSELMQGQYQASALTVFIDWMSLHNANPDTPGPWFGQGVFTAEVLEIPSMNTNGPDADEVGENVANALHQASLNSQNVICVDGISKLDNDEFGRNVRQIRLSFPFGFKPRVMPQIAPVTISPLTQGDQIVSLSCVTPGAAIFYTLDGTNPTPLNPSSKLAPLVSSGVLLSENGQPLLAENGSFLLIESGPVYAMVSVLAGQLLQARAWLAGFSSQLDATRFQY